MNKQKMWISVLKRLKTLFLPFIILASYWHTAVATSGTPCSNDTVGSFRVYINNNLPDPIMTQVLASATISHGVRSDFGYAGDDTYANWPAFSTAELCYNSDFNINPARYLQMLIQDTVTGLVGVVGLEWTSIGVVSFGTGYATLGQGLYMNSFANVAQAGGYADFDSSGNQQVVTYGVFNVALPIAPLATSNVLQAGNVTVKKIRDANTENKITALYHVTNNPGIFTNQNNVSDIVTNDLYVATFNPLELFYQTNNQWNAIGSLLPASGVENINGNYSLTPSDWYFESSDNIQNFSYWAAMNDNGTYFNNNYQYVDHPSASPPTNGPPPINTHGKGIANVIYVNLVNLNSGTTLNVYANGMAQSPVQVVLTTGNNLADGGTVVPTSGDFYSPLYNNIVFRNVANNQLITNMYPLASKPGGYINISETQGPYVLTNFSTANLTQLASIKHHRRKKTAIASSNAKTYYISSTMTGSFNIQACVENNDIISGAADEACSSSNNGTTLQALNLVTPYTLTPTGSVNMVSLSANQSQIDIDDPNTSTNRTCSNNNCLPSAIVAMNTTFPRIIGLNAYLTSAVNSSDEDVPDYLGISSVSNGSLLTPKYDGNPPIAFNVINIYGDSFSTIKYDPSTLLKQPKKKIKHVKKN